MAGPASFYTTGRIIRMAFKDAGLTQEGDEPDSEQYADGLMRLNDIANFEQTQGLKLWTVTDTPVTLTSGQSTYTLGPGGSLNMVKPLRVISAYYADSTGVRRPLEVLSWDDYTRLSQINQVGQINSYFVDKQKDQLSVFFWLVPDSIAATGTAHLILQQQIGNSISLTDELMFPIEWALFFRWALADELATGQPDAIVQRCTMKAEMYRQALEDWDVEDAPTRFMPDQRGLNMSGFR